MGSEVVEEPTETTSLSSPRKIQTNDAPTANCHVSVTPTTLSIVQPHSLLPKPVPPTTTYSPNDVVVSSSATFAKFLRQRRNDLSSAISKGISTLKHSINDL